MSLLRTIGGICLAIGLIGLVLGLLGIGTGIAALSFLKWAIIIGIILLIIEFIQGRNVV